MSESGDFFDENEEQQTRRSAAPTSRLNSIVEVGSETVSRQASASLSSTSDEEIAAAMANRADDDADAQQQQQSDDDLETSSRHVVNKIPKKRSSSHKRKEGSSKKLVTQLNPSVPAGVHSERVVARCDLDGYFYAARVLSASPQPGKVVLEFDDAPLKRSDVFTKHVVQLAGATSRPYIRTGNTVLVLVRNGVSGLYAYIPGIVALAPFAEHHQAKCYSVVAYNRRTVTAFRYQLVRISETQFTASVAYIAERAKLMGVRALAPLTKKKHFEMVVKHKQQGAEVKNYIVGNETYRRSRQSSRIQSAIPRRLSPISKTPSITSEKDDSALPSGFGTGRHRINSNVTSTHTSHTVSPTIPAFDKDTQAPSQQNSNQEIRRSCENGQEDDSSSESSTEASEPNILRAVSSNPTPRELVDRAASPIQMMTAGNPIGQAEPFSAIQQANVTKVESSSSSSSEDENDGVVRPERRRRRFEKTSPLDGSFKVRETVLARSSEDGWFYRWKVVQDLGNGSYLLRSKADREDLETAWKEHIFHYPQKRLPDDSSESSDEAEDESRPLHQDEPIDEGDFVIAKRPDFSTTFCPGQVELQDRFNHEFVVRFCDQLVGRVPMRGGCVKINEAAFNEAVMFMKHCEDRWLGERVVVLNPSKQEGGLDQVEALYVIGVVKERFKDEASDGNVLLQEPPKQSYLVELNPDLVNLCLPDHQKDEDEPFVVKQSLDHIFGRFTKSRKLQSGDFVLAPSDLQKGSPTKRAGCIIYLPGVVRAVKSHNKLLTVKLVNGLIVESLKAKDVFWLRNDYYDEAEAFYRKHHLPQVLKAERPKKAKPASSPPPKIVVEDFDTANRQVAAAKWIALAHHTEQHLMQQSPGSLIQGGIMKKSASDTSKRDDIGEMVRRCENELEHGSGPEQVMRWLLDGSVFPSERLGDMAYHHNVTLAKAIYLRAGVADKKVLDGIDSKDAERQLIASLLHLDPETAVKFAKKLNSSPSGLLSTEELAHVFSSSDKHYQQCVDFLIDAIDDDDASQTSLQNQLLELASSLGKDQVNRVVTSGKLTKVDKTKMLKLLQKAGLWDRYIEQLQFVDDIKSVLGEHAHEIDADWLVKYFENSGFSPDDMLDCIEEMLLSNKSGSKNLPAVIRLVKRFHKQLDVHSIIELLEKLHMQEALFAVLQTTLSTSRNPILTTKLIQVACAIDKVQEAEQICRDPSANFVSEVIWEYLVGAKLPKTGRLMALLCDRFNMIDQFVKFCHDNNQHRLLEAFVSRINPARLHEVVDHLRRLGADKAIVDRIVQAVAPGPPSTPAPTPSRQGSAEVSQLSAGGGYIE